MVSESWKKLEVAGISKANFPTIKKLVYGILAGFFVGIGFTSMILVEASNPTDGLYKFFGSLIFCVGILMCMFVGANLFTANCSIYAGVLGKKVKRSTMYYDLLITFIGNYIGSILIASFIWGIGILSTGDAKTLAMKISTSKIQLDWYKTFLSAIITNVLVVGCVISMIVFENKIIAFFATWIIITAFAICGFQHVVANMFITTMGGMLGIFTGDTKLVGQLFYNCLLCSMLGNFVGGIGLIWLYWLGLNKFNQKKDKATRIKSSKKDETKL